MKKSKFDPKRKYEAIESYLNRLEEEISSLDYKVGYSNLTKGERDAVYSLQNDNSVIIKEADKGCLQFLSGTERTALKRQKANSVIKNVYKQLTEGMEGPFEKIIKTVLKFRDRRDITNNTLDYFLVNNAKLGRFYLLPIGGFKMCQGNPLYQIKDIIRKTFQPSLSSTLNP